MIHTKSTYFLQRDTRTCRNQVLSIEKSRVLINAEAGIMLLDDTINYLRRSGKIKYTVSVRRYN